MSRRSKTKTKTNSKSQRTNEHQKSLKELPIKRRCLYDVLEVSRSADLVELKAAYKTQAKRWHPDRNINAVEEATMRFKEIQNAFDTLCDGDERAWYDAHRDAILRGLDGADIAAMQRADGTPGSGCGSEVDPDIDLMPYFSPFAFDGFDDDEENGFYTVYRLVFERITEIEGFSNRKVPSFGTSKSGGSAVSEFYGFWEHFMSRRSFRWMTRYNLKEATNRKMRHLMHRENRKLIDSAKKQWELTVSKLVAFIKRRDPRWRRYLIELEALKQESRRKEAAMKREIECILKMERERRTMEMEMDDDAESDSVHHDDGEQVFEALFECIACDKVFKSENSYISHQKTRKHLKAMEALKMALDLEQQLLFNEHDIDPNHDDHDDDEGDGDIDQKQDEQQRVDELIAKQMAHRQNVENIATSSDSVDGDDATNLIENDHRIALEIEQQEVIEAVIASDIDLDGNGNDDDSGNVDGDKVGDEVAVENAVISEQEMFDVVEFPESELELTAKRMSKKMKRKKKRRAKRLQIDDDDDDRGDDEEKTEEFMKTITSNSFCSKSDRRRFRRQQLAQKKSVDGAEQESSKKKTTKKKRRRRMKKESESKSSFNQNGSSSKKIDSEHNENGNEMRKQNANGKGKKNGTVPTRSECKACHQMFGSKTKLFEHLKLFPKHALISNHSAPSKSAVR